MCMKSICELTWHRCEIVPVMRKQAARYVCLDRMRLSVVFDGENIQLIIQSLHTWECAFTMTVDVAVFKCEMFGWSLALFPPDLTAVEKISCEIKSVWNETKQSSGLNDLGGNGGVNARK